MYWNRGFILLEYTSFGVSNVSTNPDMLSVRLIAMCCNEYDKIIFDIPSLDIIHVYADRKNDNNDTCTFFQHTTINMHVSYVSIICVKLAVGWPHLLCKWHSHMHEPRLIRMEYFIAVRFSVIAGLCNFRMRGNVTQYSVELPDQHESFEKYGRV